jgi:hypothetical protein
MKRFYSDEHIEILTIFVKDIIMATLESLDEKLSALATAVAAIPTIPVTPPPPAIDFTPVLNAIADLKAEVQKNVEGSAPVPTPAV